MTDQNEEPPLEGELIILREEYEGDTNVGGRPRMYESPELFDEAVNDYYQTVMKTPGEPITLMGLILFMGFADYSSFYAYGSYDGFSQSVARARSLVMYEYEKNVLLTKNSAAARILGAFDSARFNPATKLEASQELTHEEGLQQLR